MSGRDELAGGDEPAGRGAHGAVTGAADDRLAGKRGHPYRPNPRLEPVR